MHCSLCLFSFYRRHNPWELPSRQKHGLGLGKTDALITISPGSGTQPGKLAGVDLVLTLMQNPPLYLHITSTTKEGLEKAIDKVNELLHSELPPLVDERRFRRREREEQPPIERDEFGRVREMSTAWHSVVP